MTSRILLSLILFVISIAAQAQVYKWVDADGKVTYSDVPPPKTAVKVESRTYAESAGSGVTLPFELAQAVKSMPVTLYTSDNCTPCDDGRAFLKQNGIPFSEKTVNTNEDLEKLNALSGATQLPFLLIGRSKYKGLNYSDWRSSLSHAGYPESNLLPADYQFPAPVPAAPLPAAKVQGQNTGKTPNQTDQANNPDGFQF